MKHQTTQASYSQLERDLADALHSSSDERVSEILELMSQMSQMSQMSHSSNRQVVFNSYPACNSE